MRIRILFVALAAMLVAVVFYQHHDTEPTRPETPSPVIRARAHVPSRLPALAVVETASEADRERLQQDAYRSLVDALRADPAATLAELERFLADADPSKLSTQIAIGALVAVGTPEIQGALVRLVEARAGEDAFAKAAIPVMAFLEQPTIETENAIRGFTAPERSEAMQTTSHLALGIMATHLAPGEADRSSVIVADYATRLATAETPEDRRRWLQVLGNARTEEAAAAITTQLGDPDPAIRRVAVESLRLAPAADARLAAALADGDTEVRASAAWSLSHRRPVQATIDAMLAQLAVEQDEKVVAALLTAIWLGRDVAGDRVYPAVEQLARSHPSTTIRERAQTLLDS